MSLFFPWYRRGNRIIVHKQDGRVINAHSYRGVTVRFFGKNSVVEIPDNTIVGAGSIVVGKFNKTNTIIAGVPAKIVKENIVWRIENPESFIEH